MSHRVLPLILLALLVVLHAQLWFGRGSLGDVSRMREKLADQQTRNAQARQHNDQLAAEVRDLREGQEVVEERARTELNMVRPHEILVQIAK
jgi:cell division protein FtsB